MEIERESELVRLCIEEACKSKEAVERWRRQRRSLERLPPHLAGVLLGRLINRRLLFPSLLEVFKHCVEEIDLRGEGSVDAEWMAYIGAFINLRSLNLSDCHRINNSSLWPITGLTSLKELDLSRCLKVTDAGIRQFLSLPNLEKLRISETGVTETGISLLASLKNLSLLDLGGLPVTDENLNSFQVLTKLEYLDIWGSNITDSGSALLLNFPRLSFLNLAWTNVTQVPNISSLESLHMSNCTVSFILESDDGNRASLRKLVLSGATFKHETGAFLFIDTWFLSFLDVSSSSLQSFCFLEKMMVLEHLDLSSTAFGDDSVELVAYIGENLRNLNLSNTRITSAGIGILAGRVPHLETLSLSQTSVDDRAISYIGLMPSVNVLDLSNTNIRGFIHLPDPEAEAEAEAEPKPSLTSLQTLNNLETLHLDHTKLSDFALSPLQCFRQLTHLYLRSPSLTDATLHQLSSLPKLVSLGVRDAVLTNQGLSSFGAPLALKTLDLRGCWLLTEDGIAGLCKRCPQIEVTHELFRNSPSDQNTFSRQSPLRNPKKISRAERKGEILLPVSESFLDQRLKYGREELLALQDSPLSLTLPRSGDLTIAPEILPDSDTSGK